ncbi:hypothetical protein LHJ74_02405 [Streptomyces sp. N2-109]|uniref:Lipoprotein n=1 Tax=Streptomyces gossypii TaxID=2883101 RepID=A0ABT2JLP9_9ACTN|nr:hypothetical protein [Streptomyces gossypii]MCT2588800.1 hypothetical protein [Streptomyces gossypii]
MFKRRSVTVVAAGLVLAVSGCGGGDGDGADGKSGTSDKKSAKPPPKELVEWVGDMCESTTALKTVRADSTAALKKVRKPGETDPSPEFLAYDHVFAAPPSVKDVERDLKKLGRSGVSAADQLHGAWLRKLKDVRPELDKLSPSAAFDDPEGSAADADKLVQSLAPPKPDLTALTKKDRQLAAAHKRAKQCAPGWKPPGKAASHAPDPTGPLPKAADGGNSGACADSKCEILVTSSVNITAKGLNLLVTVDDEGVSLQTGDGGFMQLGGRGSIEFAEGVGVFVIAQNEDGAVLHFTPS